MNVYEALAEAQRQIGAVTKDAKAGGLNYKYRSIDALLGAAHPILSELGLVIAPRTLEHETETFQRRTATRPTAYESPCNFGLCAAMEATYPKSSAR